MRLLKTIVLLLLAALAVAMAVVTAVDGNLARITGWYRFEPGMPIFSGDRSAGLDDVSWMRLSDLHDSIECERDESGVWWIIKPFRDRMSPAAAQRILDFTRQARLVETLPYSRSVRRNIRDYGVETSPVSVTLKTRDSDGSHTTVARYTLGNTSPWLEDVGNGTDVIPTTYLRTDFYGRDRRIHVVTGNMAALFKDGLEALRDPHPLSFDPEQLRELRIARGGAQPLVLRRMSAESPWVIAEPVLTAADDDKVNALARGLSNLTALRTENGDLTPDEGDTVIQLTLEDGSTREMTLSSGSEAPIDDQAVCRASVKGRPVLFILPTERKVSHRGSYGKLISAVCELPVFPDEAMAQVRMSRNTIYTHDLTLTLPELRSLRFADIDAKDIARVALLSPGTGSSIRLFLIPGNRENDVDDTWMYAAPRSAFHPAENENVTRLLKGFSDIPVEEIVADGQPGEDMTVQKALYGLDAPTYLLMLQPNPCAVRLSLFGQDLSLVKDRSPRTFAVSRAPDPRTGKRAWFGTELGSNSIAKLSTRFTRMLSLRPEKWKSRSLADFPISAVRRLTLDYQQAPLVLDYDYIGESWKGTLGGEDVTPRINPHRAEYYIRRLQKLKVQQWLDAADEDALAALEKPLFKVKLELEITDYSDAEAAIIEQQAADAPLSGDAEQMLNEESAEGDKLRDIAMAERPTHRETRTLEITPASYDSDKPFFYGRIAETGELFILNFDDAQSLAGDMLDM